MASKLEPPPFVGPRPLRTGELLAGRGAEVQQLCDELIARRVVVLHSVAGAGKSSLINAGLVPALRKVEFDVWRPIALQANVEGLGELPAETNPYVLSAMLCLEDELPARARRRPAALAQLSFGDYVAGRPRRKRFADRNVALVFDDLDDLLTTAGEAQRRDFFAAIGNTLENPKLWALLVVRDELLAKLTLHHRQVPTRMANIFHLDRFRPDSAARVIEALAAQGERRIDDVGALVTKLVALDDGRGELDAAEDGMLDLLALQVVCRQLWAAAPEGDEGIDVDAFELGTSVSTVLGRYYGRVLRTLVEGDVEAEREIRLQVAATMAPGGRRVRVRRERVDLDDAAIKCLRGFGLVDLYEYAGGEWLSLAHARLAEPIVASDAQWLRAHSPTVSKVKGLLPGWSKRGRVEVGEHSVELEGMSWSEPPREASDEPSWLLSLTDLDGKPVVEAATSTMTTVSNPTASTPEALAQRQLARRLLEIDEAGNEARLAVALISLAQADSRWRAAARTAEGLPLSLDD
ncbi:MAG: hypothetical protein KC431_13955, partial [Myxococcales bacterium]|nr:hypothetical protein [Myxococcales bacterium]